MNTISRSTHASVTRNMKHTNVIRVMPRFLQIRVITKLPNSDHTHTLDLGVRSADAL
jgi:hypothetical protein